MAYIALAVALIYVIGGLQLLIIITMHVIPRGSGIVKVSSDVAFSPASDIAVMSKLCSPGANRV